MRGRRWWYTKRSRCDRIGLSAQNHTDPIPIGQPFPFWFPGSAFAKAVQTRTHVTQYVCLNLYIIPCMCLYRVSRRNVKNDYYTECPAVLVLRINNFIFNENIFEI